LVVVKAEQVITRGVQKLLWRSRLMALVYWRWVMVARFSLSPARFVLYG